MKRFAYSMRLALVVATFAASAYAANDEAAIDPQAAGVAYPSTGRLQHKSTVTFNLTDKAVDWWKFTCPKATTIGGKDIFKKAVAGGAYTNPAQPGSKEITLHSTQISVKNLAGKDWPANEIRLEVRRLPTPAEIQAIATGKPTQETTVDVYYWATCID